MIHQYKNKCVTDKLTLLMQSEMLGPGSFGFPLPNSLFIVIRWVIKTSGDNLQ